MLNRFEKCKNLKELYNVFVNVEGVDDFNNLTEAELERVAVVFEANLPVNAVLPVVPLNDKGYMYIWNVVVEEVETEPIPDEMEENTMNETMEMEGEEMKMKETINETAATTEEKAKATQAAKDFIDAKKESFTRGVKNIADKVKEVEDVVKEFASSDHDVAEAVFSEKAMDLLNKVKTGATKMYGNIKKLLVLDEDNAKAVAKYKADMKSLSDVIETIDTAIHSKKTAWSKFKEIVKAIASWLLKLLLKGGAEALKLTLTVTVGGIKIGATVLVTLGKLVGIIHKEVVKPTFKEVKDAWNTCKTLKAERNKEEFEEERELFFSDEEDAE